MSDVTEQVSVPANSDALANALADLSNQLIADHKAGGGAVVEVSADAIALVKAAQGALGAAMGIGPEAKAEPLGVAEAFVLAGFKVARAQTGK